MTVRDLQKLEELSAAAALGLWADDIVVALYSATQGALGESERHLLDSAAQLLELARERATHPLAPPRSARDLAATTTALSALATLAEAQQTDPPAALAEMADAIRKAATGSLTPADTALVDRVIDLFELVGSHQLVTSNSVLSSRKDVEPWTEMQPISNSS